MRILVTSLALATLAVSPALAAPKHHSTVSSAASESYAAAPDTFATSGLTTKGPAVISFGQYAGWDPDPNVRLELMRDPGLLAN